MRVRTLLVIGGVVGAVGAAVGAAVHASSGADSPNEAVFVVAGLSIVVVLAAVGFVAGWFGRERDDVVIVAAGAGIVVAAALAIASLLFDEVAFASVVLAVGVAIVSGARWRCHVVDRRPDLRRTRPADRAPPRRTRVRRGPPRLPAVDHRCRPRDPCDARPTRRAVAPGEPVDGRAVGIVIGLPRDVPVVVLLAGDQLVHPTRRHQRCRQRRTPNARTRPTSPRCRCAA